MNHWVWPRVSGVRAYRSTNTPPMGQVQIYFCCKNFDSLRKSCIFAILYGCCVGLNTFLVSALISVVRNCRQMVNSSGRLYCVWAPCGIVMTLNEAFIHTFSLVTNFSNIKVKYINLPSYLTVDQVDQPRHQGSKKSELHNPNTCGEEERTK